jgi:hypothetical protein
LTLRQNKEAEAKEELKRRAKQLEMQRREQQKRAGGGGGGSMMGGGGSGYASVPQRYDTPEPATIRSSSPAPASVRAPAFKGSGMKLGSKKVKQDQLLDALGGEVANSAPPTPSASRAEPVAARKATRGSLPTVHAEGCASLGTRNIIPRLNCLAASTWSSRRRSPLRLAERAA